MAQVELKNVDKSFGKTKPKSKSVVKGVIIKKKQSEQDNDLKQRET